MIQVLFLQTSIIVDQNQLKKEKIVFKEFSLPENVWTAIHLK